MLISPFFFTTNRSQPISLTFYICWTQTPVTINFAQRKPNWYEISAVIVICMPLELFKYRVTPGGAGEATMKLITWLPFSPGGSPILFHKTFLSLSRNIKSPLRKTDGRIRKKVQHKQSCAATMFPRWFLELEWLLGHPSFWDSTVQDSHTDGLTIYCPKSS